MRWCELLSGEVLCDQTRPHRLEGPEGTLVTPHGVTAPLSGKVIPRAWVDQTPAKQIKVNSSLKLVPRMRAPILHPRIMEHLLVAARAECTERWKGNTRGAVNTVFPVCQPGHAPLGLAVSMLLAGHQLRLRPTSESSVFFGGACDPGQPNPVFEPCLVRFRTENTYFFVSNILLKITPSLES